MRTKTYWNVVCALAFVVMAAQGQLLETIKFDPDDLVIPDSKVRGGEMIIESLRSGIVITKTSFLVCDEKSGELFGLNGNKEFGTQFSVGVMVPDGILLTDKAVHPWAYNRKFQKYSGEYLPVFYEANYTLPFQKPDYSSLNLNKLTQKVLVDSAIFRYSTPVFQRKGFATKSIEGKSSGYVLWVSSKSEKDLSEGKIELKLTEEEIGSNEDNTILEVAVDKDKFVIGLYMVPEFLSPGKISLNLVGLVSLSGDDYVLNLPDWKWDEDNHETTSDEGTLEKEDQGSLTKVDSKSLKKRMGKEKEAK